MKKMDVKELGGIDKGVGCEGLEVVTESEADKWLDDVAEFNGTDVVTGSDRNAGLEGKLWKVKYEGINDWCKVEVTGVDGEGWWEW